MLSGIFQELDQGLVVKKYGLGMIRKSVKRFSLATNAERVCAEIMPKQETKARCRFVLKSSEVTSMSRPAVTHINAFITF